MAKQRGVPDDGLTLLLCALPRCLICLIFATHIVFLVKGGFSNTRAAFQLARSNNEFEFQPTTNHKTSGSKVGNNGNVTTPISAARSVEKVSTGVAAEKELFTSTTAFDAVVPPPVTPFIPLNDLVQNNVVTSCQSDLVPFESVFLDESDSTNSAGKIPRILHVATKTRCLPLNVRNSILAWKDALEQNSTHKYSLLIHDEAAVNRLLAKVYTEFPHLQKLQQCIVHGPAKRNLWRFLVLWEYGGIYINWLDATPKTLSQLGALNSEEHDALIFFSPPNSILNNANHTSIYPHVMAASRHHPMFHTAVLSTLSELLILKHVGTTMDIDTTQSRRLFATTFRVFIQRNHNPVNDQSQKHVEKLQNANIFSGIAGRTLSTFLVHTHNGTRLRDNEEEDTPRNTMRAAVYDLPDMAAIQPPPGQGYHDTCVQYLYKQEAARYPT